MSQRAELEARYGFLDLLPERLFDAAVNHPHGRLQLRVEAIVQLRDALLSGRLPERLDWPAGALSTILLKGLETSGIALHCSGNASLTDEVLRSILAAIEQAERKLESLLLELHAESIAGAQKIPRVAVLEDEAGPPVDEILIDEVTWQRIRLDAERLAAEFLAESLRQQFEQDWSEQLDAWNEVQRILNQIAEDLGANPKRVGHRRAAIDWRKSIELRRILAQLPVLRSLVRALGRLRQADSNEGPNVLQQITGPIRRTIVRHETIREPGAIDLRGVERSDEVSRMLPSEAVLRCHPVLKRLWHARRAERALLTYHAEAVWTRRIQTEQGYADGLVEEHRRGERGPIIIVLDTSNSMHRHEPMAKAIVLQTICAAHLEGRACYLYNFSSEEQLIEYELSLTGDGLATALAFLSVSFRGSSKIDEALRRALVKLADTKWAYADLLLVTDGLLTGPKCDYDRTLVHRVDQARRRYGMRVHTALMRQLINGDLSMPSEGEDGRVYTYIKPHEFIKRLSDQIHEAYTWVDALRRGN